MFGAATLTSPPARGRPERNPQALALGAVLAAMALVVLDAAMINVSLPTIALALGVSPAEAVRAVSSYQMGVVMALLPCAALGESLGNRRLFLAGLALFAAASVLAAGAQSLTWLAAARFLQGLGAAAIMALGVALLREALPAQRMGAAIGWNALTVALCSAAGPAVGAIIISVSSWQWLFAAELPLALAALLAARALPAAGGTGRSLVWSSIGLAGAGFAFLILGAQALGTQPSMAAALLALSALSFSILARREWPKTAPVVPFDLLRERALRRAVLASICCFGGQTAGLLALPFLLQGMGETALRTGLYMTPWPIAAAAAALLSNRLASRFPPHRMCAAGGTLLAGGLAGAALLPINQASLPLPACIALCGLGFGLFQVPNNRTMLLSAPLARSAAAGGLQGTARLLGQAVGAVVLTLLFVWATPTDATRLALALGAAFALASAAISAGRASGSAEEL